MKRIVLPFLLVLLLPLTWSCSASRFGNYVLNEADAASAIRQLLELGAKEQFKPGAFSKDQIMSTVFPESMKKTLNTLQQLGLTGEIDRFTTTLSTAAEKTAERSVPIFVSGIGKMSLTDAMRIIKNGGTSATDFLRASIGDSLRQSIRPVMQEALNEYQLNKQWDNIISPVKTLSGNRLNLDLATIMAGAVSESMFRKMEEKEKQIRTDAAARTTPLLQKVFSRSWN